MINMSLRKMRKYILVVFFICAINATVFAAQSVSLYVREHQTVVCQALPAGYSVYACTFASPSTAITTYSVGYHGGYIRVDSYFTGSVNVQCDQYYYYYVGNYRYAGHRTTYFVVTCKTINITLSDTYKEMAPNGYYNITYTCNPSNSGYNPVVTWESSNLSVAQVSNTGRVHAIAPGTATITAHNGSGPDKTCTVVVQSPSPTSITVTPGTLSFTRGQDRTLSHSVSPSNASYSLIWISSNTSVATVSNGTVYGVSPGNATITARISGTSISADCYVTVQPINPTTITVNHTKSVNVGQDNTIGYSVSPSNADYSIIWTSSNTSVATVSNGVVHGVEDGTVRVTASIAGTNLYDTCRVTVVRPTLALTSTVADGWVSPGTIVALTANDNAASIRYTTDETVPTESSTLYTGPIHVNDSLTLKAIAYHTNYYPSPVLIRNYKVNNFQVVAQSPMNYTAASLPTIPTVTFNKLFTEGLNYSDIKLYVGSSIYDVTSNGVEVAGEKYIDGNTFYFIPTDVASGVARTYHLHIPSGSLESEHQEPNWDHSVFYTVDPHGSSQLVQSISFDSTEESLMMSVGDRYFMHPLLTPYNGKYDTMYWNVTDPSVVSVSQYGVVDAHSIGNSTVFVTVVADGILYSATSHIIVTGELTVSTAVDGNSGGGVYGSGSYDYLTQTTVTAEANPCYHFVQWNDGDTTNPRTFTLTQDTSFTAIFAYNEPVLGYDTATACDSYTWNGIAYSASGTYSSNTLTTLGCDSTTILYLTVKYGTINSDTATVCDNYIWNGNSYSTSGTYIYQSINNGGCDSIVTLYLNVNHSSSDIETVMACDDFIWHGTTYFASTSSPTHTDINAVGCDSVTTLHLTINYTTSGVETITACDSITWHGTKYTYSTNWPTFQMPDGNMYGCDSTVTLHLTIHNSSTSQYSIMRVCDSVILWGQTFVDDSVISHTMPNANIYGCDSTERVWLYVTHTTHTSSTVETCDNYYWHYQNYTQTPDTLPVYSQTDWNGCVNTDTLYLTIHHSSSSTDVIETCDSLTWHGTKYTYSANWPTCQVPGGNMYGCDSIVHLNLIIHRSVLSNEYVTVNDTVYQWNDSVYTQSGTYTWFGSTEFGCDSVVTLHLTLNGVGIADIDSKTSEVIVYPSPTKGIASVEAPSQITEVIVYNINGVALQHLSNTDKIDLSGMPAGIYFVRVSTTMNTSMVKIIKE